MPTLTTPSTVTFSLQVDQVLTLTNNFGAGSVVLSAQRGGDVVFDYTNDQLQNTPVFSAGSQGLVTITHLAGSLTYNVSTSSFGLTTTEVGATRALVSDAGIPFALFPSAATAGAGTLQRASDIGNALFRSDGTNWRPFNGRQVIYQAGASSLASPCATLTGNGTAQYFVLPTPALLPATLLFSGLVVEAGGVIQKRGTHTGVVRIGLATSAAGAGAVIAVSAAANAADASWVRGSVEMKVAAAGFFTTGPASEYGSFGTSTSASLVDRSDANILSADRYVVIGIEATYTDSAANLVDYWVALRG